MERQTSPNLMDELTIAPAKALPEAMYAVDEQFPRIAGYEVLRELGRGGMGVVYLARQLSINRLVALKTIHPNVSAEMAQLLVAEAQIVGKLNHPSIVPIYEAITQGDVWYFSMGLVSGTDFAHRLTKGVLNPMQVAQLGQVLCNALAHAHDQGVLHLDIKPANILLDESGRPLLTDFGLSALHRANLGDQQIVGTPQFMSPEQALNDRQLISPRSDIYCLGAVLYAALAGRPPIISASSEDLLLKVISQPPTPLRQHGLKVPRAMEAILMKCLQKKPEARYASANELAEDLAAFQSGQPVKARAPGLLSLAVYQIRKHILAATVSGSVALLLLLLVAFVFMRSWTQAKELEELRTENDRLDRLVTLQTDLMRGRLQRDSFVMQLAEGGDLRRAALFAALTIDEKGEADAPKELAEIVRAYAERHPADKGVSESNKELLQRIISETDGIKN